MQKKKVTYKPKSRTDIVNPYHELTHEELLELAGVEEFDDNFEVIRLENGKIIVQPGDASKTDDK